MILTNPEVECDECGKSAVHVAVQTASAGFVTQLCPGHLSEFITTWFASPAHAYERLSRKRAVEPGGAH